MVVRQVFVGVSGGAALAVFALFLTIPREMVEEEAPDWVRSWLKLDAAAAEAGVGEGALEDASAEPGQASGFDSGPNATSQGLEGSRRDPALLAGVGMATVEELPGDVDGGGQSAEFEEDAWETEPPEPSPDVLDPHLFVAALSKQTIIREQPDPKSRIVGFARTGALLRRAPVPAGDRGCSAGWYRVEPDGYVCVGKAATLDPEHPIIKLASLQPDRSLPMPYRYGRSRYPTPPLYTKIPSEREQKIAEQDLVGHRRKNFGSLWEEAAGVPAPSLLEEGQRVPRPYGYPVLEHDFMTGRALGNSAFAFIDLFEAEERRWGLTADLSILPLDRLQPVETSEFFGEVLGGAEDFPIAWVRQNGHFVYEGDAETKQLAPARAIDYREAFHLTGRSVRVGGATFLETTDGEFIKEHDRLVRIEAREKMPKWAKGDRSWIEVSILKQTLVAYQGQRPVFATLVSTGKDGLGDPEETHSTVQGVFLIHTKHVTSTMSGDTADDEFDLRDVPYVQYFHEGYAFHAAFWHDSFGQPRSHGCVNLSPADARHLFSVTDPPVPLRWHSALSRHGTLVYIHP